MDLIRNRKGAGVCENRGAIPRRSIVRKRYGPWSPTQYDAIAPRHQSRHGSDTLPFLLAQVIIMVKGAGKSDLVSALASPVSCIPPVMGTSLSVNMPAGAEPKAQIHSLATRKIDAYMLMEEFPAIIFSISFNFTRAFVLACHR